MAQFFQLRFTVEGVPELSRILALTNERLGNFKLPLQKSAKFILADVERNFESEGGLVGGWQPLAPSTVKGRIREGYGGAHPILQKTGRLRKSFFSTVTNTRALVTSRSPYFGFHQSRLSRKKIPRRAMLVLTEYTRQNIVQEFNKYIRGKNI
jgi:phage gpG-like protein